MPFKSEAQRRYMEANKDKLKAQGVDVDEWATATKGKKLPERVGKKPTFRQKINRAFPKEH